METENVDDAEVLFLLEEVSERTGARVNAWWRCKSCKTKKWKERAPKTIFKHAVNCGFPEDQRARLRSRLENAKLVEKANETPDTQPQPQLKSILKKTDTLPLPRGEEWKEPEPEPEDLERLELASKLKRLVIQVDPVFHIPGKSGWTLRTDSTARRRHIRILSDILYASIHRRDWQRAKRAWGLLLRTPEVEWTDIWRIGLLLLHKGIDIDKHKASEDRIEWLKTMMLKIPYYQETTLQELVIELILAKDFKQAEDQLFMYTAEYPFSDNATLRGLSGLFYLYTAQPRSTASEDPFQGDRGSSNTPDDEEEWNGENGRDNVNGEISALTNRDYTQTSATSASQSLKPTDAPDPSEPLPLHLFDPGRLQTARRHFRAALRADGRNTLAYGFLVLLGDEMVQQRRTNSHSSTLQSSDSDSDGDGDAPPSIRPLSAFMQPHSSSESDEFCPPQPGSRLEKTGQQAKTPSNAHDTGAKERLASTASPTAENSPFPQASSSEQLDPTSFATHVEVGNQSLHRNVPPVPPQKSTVDRAEHSYEASNAQSVPNNSSTPVLAPSNMLPRRQGASRASGTSQSSRDTSAAPPQLNKSVRFAETKSSEDEKYHGRTKKKLRR